MTAAVFAIPGSLDAPTGGYGYAREVIAHLREDGIEVEILNLPETFPRPETDQLRTIVRDLGQVRSQALLIIDGLALGTYPAAMIRALGRPVVGLVHHPLGYETALEPETAAWLIANEKAVLGACSRVIASSPFTRNVLVDEFEVFPERIIVAPPGTERVADEPYRGKRQASSAVRLLSVGSVVPRKGHDVLVKALGRLRRRYWELDIVGSRSMDPAYDREVREQIIQRDLEDRIRLRGEVDTEQLRALYRNAEIFVLATRYEGYGMAFAEAMSHGLPVVGTNAGNVPMLVPEEAGYLVPVDDDAALADALGRLMEDRTLRMRLGKGGFEHAKTLPTWRESAATIGRLIRELAP